MIVKFLFVLWILSGVFVLVEISFLFRDRTVYEESEQELMPLIYMARNFFVKELGLEEYVDKIHISLD